MADEPRVPRGEAPTPPAESASLRAGADDPHARSFEEVLDAELDAVGESRRLRTGRPQAPLRGRSAIERAHDARLVGLSFSGGGIRSATFNLGIIQGLARLGLLRRFDYLSVNSGGGYIGGWLTAWIRRRGLARVERELATDACRSPEAEAAGADAEARAARGGHESGPEQSEGGVQEGQDVEAGTIRFLRQFSNYLTPRVGAFSADTWTLVTTYLRNLLLNLVILVAALGAILLVPRLVLVLSRHFGEDDGYLLFGLALLFLAVAVVGIGWNMFQILSRERRDHEPWPSLTDQGWTQLLVVAPLFVSAWFTSLWLWFTKAGAEAGATGGFSLAEWLSRWFPGYSGLRLGDRGHEVVAWILLSALVYALVWFLAFAWWLVQRGPDRRGSIGRFWRAVLAGAPIAGGVGGFLLWGVTRLSASAQTFFGHLAYPPAWHLLHINVWKPPAITVVFLLTAFVHTGLMGRSFPESLRQWWSRLGAWMLIYSITWLGLFGVAIYGPDLLILLPSLLAWAMAGGWLGSTVAGVLVGKGSSSPASAEQKPPLVRRIVIAVVPQLFIVGLLALVALGLHVALSPSEPETDAVLAQARAAAASVAGPYEVAPAAPAAVQPEAPVLNAAHRVVLRESARDWAGSKPGATLGLLALLAFIAAVLSWRVDINDFSMHLFYRNRLIRAYLGASNPNRLQQPFTGFDPADDVPLATLSPFVALASDGARARGYDGPYPIHNMTLNLVAGKELAWQERKASAFVATPLFTGFDVYQGKPSRNLAAEGFRPTGGYDPKPRGLTLGTAMGISGAAVSPNMGAGTTPAMAFLLTVFNVRLGWWLGNPRRERTWPKLGPTFGLLALLSELFGHTDETSRFVYLSDGGHFENLALYELIRRRCRFIVATDAGADPNLSFGDLGNLVRKCCTDFGIEVEVDTAQIHRDPATGKSLWHCAVGTIRYDRIDPGAAPGTLLYVKSSLTGDEPADTQSYATEHGEFPHQSTADQWFGESQFESYRKLGEHIILSVLHSAVEDPGTTDVERLFVDLREIWYPPATAEEGSFSRHAHALSDLVERLSSEKDLGFLAAQLFPEWRELTGGTADRPPTELWLPERYEERRAGFFFCTALIQLMEAVYLDLRLEAEYDHPDNRGWMNLFNHWTWSGMFRVTWAVTASTYGARFQTFAEHRLGLGPGFLAGEVVPLGSAGELDALETDPRFNFLEVSLVRRLVEKNPGLLDRLFVLRLVVRDPTSVGQGDGGELRFTFGIAAASGEELIYFRVQDHLRKMGLGRAGLAVLIRNHGIRALRDLGAEELPEWTLKKPGEHDTARFRRLFRSVLYEVLETPGAASA